MIRDRLIKEPAGKNLSFSKYVDIMFEEPLILHDFAQKSFGGEEALLRFKDDTLHLH